MRILVAVMALAIGGCASAGGALAGFSRGVGDSRPKRQLVCKPSPYIAGQTVCEER